MVGFLIQWPTIPTLLMFLVLAITYRRLAIREEREVRDQFTGAWDDYASQAPRFIPVRRGRRCGEQADAPDTLRTSASLARGGALTKVPRWSRWCAAQAKSTERVTAGMRPRAGERP
jgi:hypothetical protein